MIDLYMAGTANGYRASVVLDECGLAYRVRKVDLAKGEQRSAEFLKVNPAGVIPAIIDTDGPGGKPLTLTQSGAIILYAAEKTGKLIPKDPVVRATAFEWFMQAATDVSATSSALFRLENSVPEKILANTEFFKARLLKFFKDCDQHLQGKEFLAGNEMSVADIHLYPNFALRKALVDAAGGLANLQRWGATMAARPGVQKGMAAAG